METFQKQFIIPISNTNLVELEPKGSLVFSLPFNVPKSTILKIRNITSYTVVFKVKTNVLNNYIVIPNCGELKANEVKEIEIRRVATTEKYKDKFLIQSCCIEDNELNQYRNDKKKLNNYILNKFCQIDKHKKSNPLEVKKYLRENYLRCIYLQPKETELFDINNNIKDSSSLIDHLINISSKIIELDPSDTLSFPLPFNVPKSTILKIRNITNYTALFKVKITVPNNYIVIPNCGELKANEIKEIEIRRVATTEKYKSDYKCNDKFLIQSCCIEDNVLNQYRNDKKKLNNYIMNKFCQIDNHKKSNPLEVKKCLCENYIKCIYCQKSKANNNITKSNIVSFLIKSIRS